MFDKFRLKDVLVQYKKDFVTTQWGNEKYKWEAVKCFQDNWDVNAEDFADMLMEVEEVGTNVRLLKKQPLDMPFGAASGGGFITEAGGGVSEAVARCLIADKSAEALQKFSYSGFYGSKARREAVLTLGGEEWKFAIVCGCKAADALIEEMQRGEVYYDYVEVLAC